MNTNGGFRTLAGNAADAYQNAGAPVDGVDAVLRLTSTATSGTFPLTITNPLTGALIALTGVVYNVTAAALQVLIRAAANYGAGVITCTGGPLNTTAIDITFTGDMSGLVAAIPVVSNAAMVGGTVVPSIATAGVQGTQRGAGKGSLLVDNTTPKLYQNTGTANKPVYEKVGSQT